MVSPAASSSRNRSQVAHSGTSRELASSTLGAKLWVRNTPTGLPDWTRRVSSAPRRRRVATTPAKRAHARGARPPRLHPRAPSPAQPAPGSHDPVEGRPVPAPPPGAAVHDQVVGPFGDLGVEVVAEHPQGALLLPAAAGEA